MGGEREKGGHGAEHCSDIAVRWDVGVTGMEGDGTWGRDRRLDGSWEGEGMGGGDGMYLS